jgi:hypothetical protein
MRAPVAIKRIKPVSIKEFNENYVGANSPVVISGLVDEWPAFERWDFGYFAQNFGDVNAGVIRIKQGECDYNTHRGSAMENTRVSEAIDSIEKGQLDNGWAMITPVDAFPEKLQKDYSTPVYCANGKFLRSRVFVGPKGTITSLHQDLPENLYVIVKGKKRITLFAPSSSVYPNARFSKLPNHAQIDVEKPDYKRFPHLKEAQPYLVDLSAGETLFIPSFWWHHLRNLEPTIAINFWWSQGWKLPIAWTAAMYKKLRGI